MFRFSLTQKLHILQKKIKKQSVTVQWVIVQLKKELKKSFWLIMGINVWFLFIWSLVCFFEPEDSMVSTFSGYWYFQSTIFSTVGSGDIVPQSVGGRFVASVLYYCEPIFFATYGFMIYHDLRRIYDKAITGDIIVNIKNHIPIISFQRNRTDVIVQNMLADERRKPRQLLLCFDIDKYSKNPMRGVISGLSVKTGFKSDKFLRDACIDKADRILVDTGDDNLNIALCVITKDVNPSAHIVVAFDIMQGNVDVIKHLGNGIECVPTSMPELIARCLQDPGSSYTILDMVDAEGQTKYRLQVPKDFVGCTWGDLKDFFKSGNNRADAIAAGHDAGGKLEVNPPNSRRIEEGMFIEYLRSKRFRTSMINWEKITSK